MADDDTPDAGVEELVEIGEFFTFAVKPDATWRGTVQFRLTTTARASGRFDMSVRIHDDGTVVWWEGDPPDGSLDVIMDMSQADFLKVYSGTASAAAVSKMVLSGRLYVHSFNYRGLQKFANSFDYSSQKWIDFYKHRDAKHAEAQAAAEEAARMAQEEAAQARVLIEASPGFVLVEHPDDKDAQLRTIAKEMAQAQRVLALVLGDTAQQKLDNVLELDAQQFLAASAAAAAQPMFPARLHATETPSSRSRGGRGASSNGADASQSQKSKKKKAVQKKRVRLRDRLFKQLRGGDSDVDGEPELGPGLSIFLGDGPAGTADKIRLPRVVRERLSRSLPSTTKEPSAPDLGPGLSVFLGEAPVKTPRTPPTLTAGATCNQARAAADGAGAGAGGAKLQAADAATNVGSQPPVEVVSEPSPVVDTGTSSTVASSEGAVAVGGTAGGGGAVTSPAPEVASTTTTTTEALPAAPAKPDVASPVTEHESSSTTAVSPAAASPMLLRVSRALQETCNAADQGGDVFHDVLHEGTRVHRVLRGTSSMRPHGQQCHAPHAPRRSHNAPARCSARAPRPTLPLRLANAVAQPQSPLATFLPSLHESLRQALDARRDRRR